MNDKVRQYYNVINDKNLLDKKNPTESDLAKFMILREAKRIQLKKSLIGASLTTLIMVPIGIIIGNLFGVGFILFGIFLEYFTLKEFLVSKKWTPDFCDYGYVVDKYIKEDDDRDYYVIVSANGNIFKFELNEREFLELNISDNVILFAIKNKKDVFMVKNY